MLLNPSRFTVLNSSTNSWSPTAKDSTIALSNSNLTATHSTNVYGGVKGITGRNAGKHYCEVNIDNITTEFHFGAVNAASTTGNIANSNSIGGVYLVTRNDGLFFTETTNLTPNTAAWAVGQKMGMSIDFATLVCTIYKNGASVKTRTMPADTYFPFFNGFGTGVAVTIQAAPTYLPAGFESW